MTQNSLARLFRSPSRLTVSPKILATCIVALTVGCGGSDGPPRGEVTGTAKVGDQPIDEGAVTFEPINGTTGPATGAVIKDGVYHIERSKGPFVGEYRVSVRGFRRTGKKIQLAPDAFSEEGEVIEEQESIVPPIYYEKSPLEFEVAMGENTFDILIPAE